MSVSQGPASSRLPCSSIPFGMRRRSMCQAIARARDRRAGTTAGLEWDAVQLHDDGTLVVSATDLVGFLECDHLVTLEQARARGELEKPYPGRPASWSSSAGAATSTSACTSRSSRRRAGRSWRCSSRDPKTPAELRAAEAETLAAMRAGIDVIFQGTFFDGRWRGHPDFLVRRDDRPSDLGPWSYDVADTKLAKRVKAAAIVQMCVYADQLERLQGIPPETIRVVTGDRESHEHRLADYAAYYRSARRRFEARVFPAAPARPRPTYPEPVDHCRVCSWWAVCMDRRRADDHLSIVAGAARVAAAEARRCRRHHPRRRSPSSPPGRGVRNLNPPRILERLRRQAALQLEQRDRRRRPLRADPAQPGRAGQGPRRAAAARHASTCSSTSRRTRGRSTTASSTCSAGPRWCRAASPPSTRCGRTTGPRRRRCSRRSSTS